LVGIPFIGTIRRQPYLDGGAAALELVDDSGEQIATLSTNLRFSAQMLPDANHTFIKDYSENTGVLEQLIEHGIVRDTGARAHSGFVEIPVVEIIEKELRI
jgi:hypothetical protein